MATRRSPRKHAAEEGIRLAIVVSGTTLGSTNPDLGYIYIAQINKAFHFQGPSDKTRTRVSVISERTTGSKRASCIGNICVIVPVGQPCLDAKKKKLGHGRESQRGS